MTVGSSGHPEPHSLRAAPVLDFNRIWEDNRRWVAAVILAHKPKWADVEDVLQDIAASLVSRGHEIRDLGSVRTWLRTVAINAARLAGRKGKLRQMASIDEPATPAGGSVEFTGPSQAPPSQLGHAEESSRLIDLALELPEGYREPLLLKAVHGLSYRQIGQILGLPETTVETRIARGRRMLREAATTAAPAE